MTDRLGRTYNIVIAMHPEGHSEGELPRREQAVWAASAEHRVEESDPLPVALYPQGCLFRSWAMQALDKANRPWLLAFVSQSLSAVEAIAALGLAATVVKSGTFSITTSAPVGARRSATAAARVNPAASGTKAVALLPAVAQSRTECRGTCLVGLMAPRETPAGVSNHSGSPDINSEFNLLNPSNAGQLPIYLQYSSRPELLRVNVNTGQAVDTIYGAEPARQTWRLAALRVQRDDHHLRRQKSPQRLDSRQRRPSTEAAPSPLLLLVGRRQGSPAGLIGGGPGGAIDCRADRLDGAVLSR
jgi:hypothetical protein